MCCCRLEVSLPVPSRSVSVGPPSSYGGDECNSVDRCHRSAPARHGSHDEALAGGRLWWPASSEVPVALPDQLHRIPTDAWGQLPVRSRLASLVDQRASTTHAVPKQQPMCLPHTTPRAHLPRTTPYVARPELPSTPQPVADPYCSSSPVPSQIDISIWQRSDISQWPLHRLTIHNMCYRT